MRRCCAKDCFNSQMNTKGVSYFRFPKSEYYAKHWAHSAGRTDLLNKPLHLMVKYFLCSEHFTDDCFQDPPNNTTLRKSIRPVKAPIPTIFRNNIAKFLPSFLRHPDEKSVENERLAFDDSLPSEDTTTILVIPETLARRAQEETNVHPCQLQGKLVNFSEDSDDGVIEKTEQVFDFDTDPNENLCRLCACRHDMEDLYYIFDNETITQTIDLVLPGQVKKDDGFSHMVCSECMDKAKQCEDAICGFRMAQAVQMNMANSNQV